MNNTTAHIELGSKIIAHYVHTTSGHPTQHITANTVNLSYISLLFGDCGMFRVDVVACARGSVTFRVNIPLP